MRRSLEMLFAVVMCAVAIDGAWRWGDWFSSNAGGYWLIWLAAILFVAVVYAFDRFAEAQGLIVHHWWAD